MCIRDRCTIAENRDTASFIWDNYYDCEEQINEYDLTLFIPEEEAGKNIYLSLIHISVLIAISLTATIFMAKLIGCVLPLFAGKLHLDPAIMAAPLITTIAVSYTHLVDLANN